MREKISDALLSWLTLSSAALAQDEPLREESALYRAQAGRLLQDVQNGLRAENPIAPSRADR